jgi:hypothetical protein
VGEKEASMLDCCELSEDELTMNVKLEVMWGKKRSRITSPFDGAPPLLKNGESCNREQ